MSSFKCFQIALVLLSCLCLFDAAATAVNRSLPQHIDSTQNDMQQSFQQLKNELLLELSQQQNADLQDIIETHPTVQNVVQIGNYFLGPSVTLSLKLISFKPTVIFDFIKDLKPASGRTDPPRTGVKGQIAKYNSPVRREDFFGNLITDKVKYQKFDLGFVSANDFEHLESNVEKVAAKLRTGGILVVDTILWQIDENFEEITVSQVFSEYLQAISFPLKPIRKTDTLLVFEKL